MLCEKYGRAVVGISDIQVAVRIHCTDLLLRVGENA